MKIVTAIVSVFLLHVSATTATAQLHRDEDGRWLNSRGGNIYGDSRFNLDADPRYNLDADPRYNLDADPRYNPFGD